MTSIAEPALRTGTSRAHFAGAVQLAGAAARNGLVVSSALLAPRCAAPAAAGAPAVVADVARKWIARGQPQDSNSFAFSQHRRRCRHTPPACLPLAVTKCSDLLALGIISFPYAYTVCGIVQYHCHTVQIRAPGRIRLSAGQGVCADRAALQWHIQLGDQGPASGSSLFAAALPRCVLSMHLVCRQRCSSLAHSTVAMMACLACCLLA